MDTIVIGGGQSGLAAARALRAAGLHPRRARSRRPAHRLLAALLRQPHPVLPRPLQRHARPRLPGDPDRYPTRDEVGRLPGSATPPPSTPNPHRRPRHLRGRPTARAASTSTPPPARPSAPERVAASGSFGNPYMPVLPGQAATPARAARGRLPQPQAVRRAARHRGRRRQLRRPGRLRTRRGRRVTLATRQPLRFVPQIVGGRDLHYWHTTTGFDRLPPPGWPGSPPAPRVLDTGDYAAALPPADSPGARCSPPSTATVVWPTAAASTSIGNLRDRLPAGPGLSGCARRPWTHDGLPPQPAACPPPIPGWATSAWNSSVPSPPTPCAAWP